jgi:hypothetical protein
MKNKNSNFKDFFVANDVSVIIKGNKKIKQLNKVDNGFYIEIECLTKFLYDNKDIIPELIGLGKN